MNIVLIGYRCTGKTVVGNMLARCLGLNFRDTDRLVETATGSPIHLLVSQKGWSYFRAVERKIIREVSEIDNQVIATGGGVVMDDNNVQDLKKKGWIVWLKATAEVLKQRMESAAKFGENRPSLTGADAVDEIYHVLPTREPQYAQAGDLVIDTNGYSPLEVTVLILKGLPPQFIRKGYKPEWPVTHLDTPSE
jgi:shikimate kinase